MIFDLPTLAVTSALTVGVVGALILMLSHRMLGASGGDTPLGLWAAALLVGAAALLSDGLQPLPGNLLSNVLLLLAAALSWTAARVFGGRMPVLAIMLGAPPVWLAVALWLPGASGFVVACGMGAAFTLATAWELWRCRNERLPSLRLALMLLVTHAVIYVARTLSGFWPDTTAFQPGVTAVLLLEGTLHAVGMGIVLLVLVAERASVRATAGLRRQALVDGLTELSNRRHFDMHIVLELRRASRQGLPVALLLIDTDHFKRFNDRYGHLEGDNCLRKIADCLGSFIRRPGDLAARFGGEEFAVVLPNTNLAGAVSLADAIRTAVADLGIPHESGAHQCMTVSVGVAAIVPPPGTDSSEALILSADRALYVAKDAGRNVVCVAPETASPDRSQFLAAAD